MFKNLFSTEKKPSTKWEELTQAGDLDQYDELSVDKPVVIFKHSTRCGVSSMAQSGLQREFERIADKVHFRYLDLIKNRPISNLIAERYHVRHESPQLIIIKNKKVLGHASHSGVSVAFIESHLS